MTNKKHLSCPKLEHRLSPIDVCCKEQQKICREMNAVRIFDANFSRSSLTFYL